MIGSNLYIMRSSNILKKVTKYTGAHLSKKFEKEYKEYNLIHILFITKRE